MPPDSSATPSSTDQSQSPERLTQAASGIVDQAGRTAERQASLGMDKAGDTLEQVARAVRDSGSQIRDQQPQIADAAEFAAQRVEGVATYLRDHDAREIVAEAERIARRQPALVIGGGLVLGLLAGRLLRSGAEPGSGQTNGAGWTGDSGSYQGTAGWSGGSSSDVRSGNGYGARTGSISTGAAGTSSPSTAYGTGYGGSYETSSTGTPESTAENLAATDAATLTGDTAGGSGTTRRGSTGSTTRRRTSRSTGEA
jgi:hypothetical protein